MPKNDAFILTLAYPETIVTHAEEWYSKLLRLIGIGNKKHVRAGHAAMVLIDKNTGVLEYHDFGRYITTSPNGRVRGHKTDFELNFPLKAEINNDSIENLEDILKFLATNPKLTHGDGDLYASVCNAVDYKVAQDYVASLQDEGFITYAAFKQNACNCARFVTDTLITSVTDLKLKEKLIKSKWFTPSTIGNVVLADTENFVYRVTEKKEIFEFTSSVGKENRRLFLDVLKGYNPSLEGTLMPKHNDVKSENAQWLGGIGSGAWFEIHALEREGSYRCRRISPYGNIDCDGIYNIKKKDFNIGLDYKFLHKSNCMSFCIEQGGREFKFEYQKDYTSNSKKKAHLV